MYVTHSLYNTDYLIQPTDLTVGQLFINFINKGIYTKTLNSRIIRIGNSIRSLIESPEYIPGIETSNSGAALLQFKTLDNYIYLTTVYPFIALMNLYGTDINKYTINSKSYLQIDNNIVINNSKPTFNIENLGDVSNLTLTSNFTNYVLSSNTTSSSGITFNKDSFISKYFYYWSLKPEHTKLLLCDDVLTIAPLNTYYILRSNKLSENKNKPLETHKFAIKYDLNPELSNNLKCNSYSIYNQIYTLKVYTITSIISTVSINPHENSLIIIDCQNSVYVLNLDFQIDTSLINTLIPLSIVVKNFEGAINLPSYVKYENGLVPNLTGKEHIFNCLVYNVNNKPDIILLQKSTNISKVKK